MCSELHRRPLMFPETTLRLRCLRLHAPNTAPVSPTKEGLSWQQMAAVLTRTHRSGP